MGFRFSVFGFGGQRRSTGPPWPAVPVGEVSGGHLRGRAESLPGLPSAQLCPFGPPRGTEAPAPHLGLRATLGVPRQIHMRSLLQQAYWIQPGNLLPGRTGTCANNRGVTNGVALRCDSTPARPTPDSPVMRHKARTEPRHYGWEAGHRGTRATFGTCQCGAHPLSDSLLQEREQLPRHIWGHSRTRATFGTCQCGARRRPRYVYEGRNRFHAGRFDRSFGIADHAAYGTAWC